MSEAEEVLEMQVQMMKFLIAEQQSSVRVKFLLILVLITVGIVNPLSWIHLTILVVVSLCVISLWKSLQRLTITRESLRGLERLRTRET